jgi:ketosteroid isomerase-like protein
MSEENIAIVRTLIGAFFRRDGEVMEALMAPDVEWRVEAEAAGQVGLPLDLAGTYKGAEGTRAFWRGWLSSWQDLTFDYELRASGDDVVLALIRNQRQWGRHSGVETEVPPYTWVYTLRDGRVVSGRFVPGHAPALEEFGLG